MWTCRAARAVMSRAEEAVVERGLSNAQNEPTGPAPGQVAAYARDLKPALRADFNRAVRSQRNTLARQDLMLAAHYMNAANGTEVGITANAIDADATNNAVTYSLSNSIFFIFFNSISFSTNFSGL